jgi:hypothetical protein
MAVQTRARARPARRAQAPAAPYQPRHARGRAIPLGQPPRARGRHRAPPAYQPRQPGNLTRGIRQTGGQAAGQVQKTWTGAPRVMIAEFLFCVVLVAAKPFEKVHADAKFSEGTIGQFAAVMILFFVLALFGGISGRTQKIANLFGALVCLGLLFKNTDTLAGVTNAIAGGVAASKSGGSAADVGTSIPVPGTGAPTPSGQVPEPIGEAG